MYKKLIEIMTGAEAQCIKRLSDNAFIPFDPANTDYQVFLDDIIEQGAACLDGDIPADIQAAADERLFNRQLSAYKAAVERLSQYVLADGRPEVKEMQPTGEQTWDEATMEMVDVMREVVVQTAVEPLEPTVEVTVYGEGPNPVSTVQTVPNPLIVADNEQRTAAQAVVDATPQAVKDAAV